MEDEQKSEADRIAENLRVLAGEVDLKLGGQAAMLRYLLDMAYMEALDMASRERNQG